MKNFFVKAAAVSMCLALAVTSITGCGNKEKKTSGSSDKVKIYTNMKNRPDSAAVSAEVSKIAKEKLGFDVEICFGYGQDKISLMLASNEQMDVGFDNSVNFVDRVRQGAYADITEKVKTVTPKLYEAIPKELWEGSMVDGKIYAVPTYKEFAEVWTVLVDKKIVEESGIDVSTIKELKDVEPLLATLKKHPERAGFEINASSDSHVSLVLKNKYDAVNDYFVVKRDEPDKVVHFMETQEYKDFVYMMHDWYKKGYIAKDIATLTDYDSYNNSGNIGMTYVSYHPSLEIQQGAAYGVELVPIHVTPITKSNTSMMGSLFGVYKKSKNIDNTLKFLELWNTDPEVKNLITYGIEGKHYTKNADGKVKRTDGALDMYKFDNAVSGNMTISYLLENEPDNKYELFDEFNEAAINSSTLGFFPALDSIKSEMMACQAAITEYNSLLCVGAVNPDEYLPKMLTALKESGVDRVKAELQKQYDEWRK